MPLPSTMTPIATNTLTTTTASVTFSNLPQNYTDLIVVMNSSQTIYTNFNVRINGDTGNNYSDTAFRGNGSTATSGRNTSQPYFWFAAISSTWSTVILNFMNYSSSSVFKTVLQRASDASQTADATIGLWRSTAAVTSISIFPNAGSFNTGSTFTIYGVKAA